MNYKCSLAVGSFVPDNKSSLYYSRTAPNYEKNKSFG